MKLKEHLVARELAEIEIRNMICPTCRIAMLMCKHFGGGVYWYCSKCGCTIESTSAE